MATFTITISDLLLPRIQATFPNMTIQQIADQLKNNLKLAVINHEAAIAETEKRTSVTTETW